MLKNIDVSDLVKSKPTTDLWNVNIKVDSSYRDKVDFITNYYNDNMEKAPTVTDMFRNVIDKIYEELNGKE